jgi:hypothetical protein
MNVLITPPTISSLNTTGLNLPSYNGVASSARQTSSSLQCSDPSIKISVFPKLMREIFADLRHLSSVLESRNSFLIENVDGAWYSDKVYLVQRNLVHLSLEPEQAALHTAYCIAGSMYVNSYLRDMGFNSGVTALLATKLKNFVEQNVLAELTGYDDEELRIFFWILVIGGISAMGVLERGWFVKCLGIVREVLKLDDRSDAEEVLGKLVWSKDLNVYFEDMWHEVADNSRLQQR